MAIDMPEHSRRAVQLAPADHDFIESQVRSGRYASQGEVIGAGLQALQAENAALDDWLLNEVAPVYDAMATNPARGIPATEVFARLRSRTQRHAKDKA